MIERTYTQRQIWENWAGDLWLKDNRPDIGYNGGKDDPVVDVLVKLKIKPERVLEIGCCNGWRLKSLKDKFHCVVGGVDPSKSAIAEAVASGIAPGMLSVGTADRLPVTDGAVDLVIFGFCLCFIAPEDWPALVSEATRVLQDGGHLIIHDFCFAPRPMRIAYKELKTEEENSKELKVYIYHFDWPSLWLNHPGYKLVHEAFNRGKCHSTSVLKKDFEGIWLNEDMTP